jgi:hypothetical protein
MEQQEQDSVIYENWGYLWQLSALRRIKKTLGLHQGGNAEPETPIRLGTWKGANMFLSLWYTLASSKIKRNFLSQLPMTHTCNSLLGRLRSEGSQFEAMSMMALYMKNYSGIKGKY